MIITISRQFGSGGSAIGHKIAEKLCVPCYDKTVSELTSVETGFSHSFISNAEDKYSGPFTYSSYLGVNSFLPVYDQIFFAQREVIVTLAQKKDCVIVGRCGAPILREHNIPSFNVFICAPLNERIERTAKKYSVGEKEAAKMIKKNDKARAVYNKQYADFEWGKVDNYDLCVNSTMGEDKVVDLILAAVKKD